MAHKATLVVASLLGLCTLSQQQKPQCKTTPFDAAWPSDDEWYALNDTISGTLIEARPAASSCYSGNPFGSPYSCDEVEQGWNYSSFQALLPESVNYQLFANNSCLPPGTSGYTATKGCKVGCSPQYIVNATAEEHIATAVKWASDRNIRIVIKGTGHDLSGRSSGSYALSIWTHNFKQASYNTSWSLPGSNITSPVMTLGSGHTWGSASRFAAAYDKVIVGGQDETVGLGGHIQGGGHGPLSSRFGLAADQILQARVVTMQGVVLVVDDQQNEDLLWAIRGGGAGQYGIVTEYVLVAHPNPGNVIITPVTLNTANATVAAGWSAFAQLLAGIPDLMDLGITGSGIASAAAGSNGTTGRVTASASLYAYNSTAEAVLQALAPLQGSIRAASNGTITLTTSDVTAEPDFISFFNSINSSPSSAGGGSVMTSRLLGRADLSGLPIPTLTSYLQRVLVSQTVGGSALGVFGLQGGPGPRDVAEGRRGALNPAWRTAYVHLMSYGTYVNTTIAPSTALKSAADWLTDTVEPVWREWSPGMGAYMNEGNCFLTTFKEDFYGEPYDRLLEVKKKYDPTESLFVLSGVGSDAWDYDLNSGRLCQTQQ